VRGIDISREALIAAHRRLPALNLAVASLARLPMADASCDLVMNIFAPVDAAEFRRVLRRGGTLLRVVPLERHLWELKEAVYDVPYENEIDTLVLDGFDLLEKREITFPLALGKQEYIDTLFKMTPYYYKTSREGQARLRALDSLQTHAEFLLAVYQKA
jgi:23S rRNA (guanine745-N1)-methyltransferase